MDCSTPGSSVFHYLPEFAQIHVHWVSNATYHPIICLPLQSPFAFSLPASGSFPLSLLFASGGQSIGASASALPMTMQGWFSLGLIILISLQSKGLSRVFSNTTVQKYQFFGVQPFLWFSSHTEPKLIQTSVFDYSFCEMGWVISILTNESLKVLEILDNTGISAPAPCLPRDEVLSHLP